MTDIIFLETTIQIDRFYSPKSEREVIKNNLAEKSLASSSYVLGEFCNNIIKDAILYYSLLCDEASENPMDALVRLSKYTQHRPRINNRIHKILSSMSVDINNKEQVKKRLEMLIEKLFIKRFKKLQIYLNETSCVRAEPIIYKNGGVYEFENKCTVVKKPNCKIEEFINKNITQVKKITKLNEPEKIVNELNLICKGKKPVGRSCWTIGDCIISLEVPKQLDIYTTNEKDFLPICNQIGKILYNRN